ncbi:MAG: FtsW/RodA/SpoVE family cell cycle protein [Oscillospiraceae bacterium]|jgi:rod shape determining protein RodA|nr:FtsW/RodA/SpoVE family cell cycle protein [Oscillospiraceae bacterium]
MALKYRTKQQHIMGNQRRRGLKLYAAGTDWLTLAVCLLASAFGILLVHSATLREISEDSALPFHRDAIVMAAAVALGALVALLLSFVDYELLLRFWFVLGVPCVVLMCSLLLPGVASSPEGRDDAINWIKIPGIGIFFQPSELLKIGFIISFTSHLYSSLATINKVKTILLLGLHAAVPFGLVVLTGDMGSALVFLCITAGMLFLAGVKLRYFAAAGALGAAAFPILWIYQFSNFQKDRILAVYFPSRMAEDTYKTVIYQQQQARYAMGTGQLFGKGLFKGDYVQTGSVPESQNDMIFSVAGEELGFVGAIAVMLVLVLVIVRLARVSSHTRNVRARLLCCGVAVMIGAQAMINIGMCIMLLPVIGITLPFFSAGGSSNLCLYLAVGLIMTVYRHQDEHEDTQSYFDYLYS